MRNNKATASFRLTLIMCLSFAFGIFHFSPMAHAAPKDGSNWLDYEGSKPTTENIFHKEKETSFPLTPGQRILLTHFLFAENCLEQCSDIDFISLEEDFSSHLSKLLQKQGFFVEKIPESAPGKKENTANRTAIIPQTNQPNKVKKDSAKNHGVYTDLRDRNGRKISPPFLKGPKLHADRINPTITSSKTHPTGNTATLGGKIIFSAKLNQMPGVGKKQKKREQSNVTVTAQYSLLLETFGTKTILLQGKSSHADSLNLPSCGPHCNSALIRLTLEKCLAHIAQDMAAQLAGEQSAPANQKQKRKK